MNILVFKPINMVRTLVTPQQQNISIHLPSEYVGKQVEVLVYAVDELTEEKKTSPNAAKYKGIFSREEGDKFNEHINQARNEWDRDF